MRDLLIIGAGGFGRELLAWVRDVNEVSPTYRVVGFLDGDAAMHGTTLHGVQVLGDIDRLEAHPGCCVAIAVGAPHVRRRIHLRLMSYDVRYPTIIHPTCTIGEAVDIGEGGIVCPGTTLTTDIQLGKMNIVNLDCTVGHDATTGDYVTLAPGVHVSGNVHIRDGCDLGTGAVLVPGVEVGPWTIVGAGAVVARTLPRDVVAVGMPAKPIKTRELDWQLG